MYSFVFFGLLLLLFLVWDFLRRPTVLSPDLSLASYLQELLDSGRGVFTNFELLTQANYYFAVWW
jgi:hypothetical protein